LTLRQSDSIAAALVKAIRTGNLESLLRLLAENPGLAVARIHDEEGRARRSTSPQTGPVTFLMAPLWLPHVKKR
jgi:hypothetical protein